MAMELTRINPDQQRAARALLSVRGTNLTETAQSAPARWARETRAWSRFRKFENQKCLRPPLREDDRENNSAHSWLVHVFTQPGSKGDIGRRRDHVCFTPRTDIGDGKCEVRFVPIVLQKSQNAVRLIFRQKTNQATTADRCILKRASEVANELSDSRCSRPH